MIIMYIYIYIHMMCVYIYIYIYIYIYQGGLAGSRQGWIPRNLGLIIPRVRKGGSPRNRIKRRSSSEGQY